MNKFFFIILIIVFFIKTGNLLSNSNIFDVDNIKIIKKNDENKQDLLDRAFKKGFYKLVDKILLKKDSLKIIDTNIVEIKKLISSYQITKRNKHKFEKDFIINLSFNREKINEFLYNKNISYADISNSNIIIFPILIEQENLFIFNNNFFYDNWITQKDKDENDDNFIEYVLPVENLDDIEYINKNKENLEKLNTKKILSNYDIKDYILIIINYKKDKSEIFLKGYISYNEIIKNILIDNLTENKTENYNNIISKIKYEVSEIWKSQNLIDVRTPSFLNVTLDINNKNDLLNLQNTLNKIDIIQSHNVLELNKNFARIKIKYIGKINKIKKKFDQQNIKVIINNNQWKIKLI